MQKISQSQIDIVMRMRGDYALYIEKMLGDTLEDFQKELCRLVNQHDYLNVKACHSVGKTWTMARIGLAFLNLYTNCKVITTAPTFRQVQKLLWGEIRAAHSRARTPLGGKVNQTEITMDDDHFMIGFSPKTGAASESAEQKDSSFQGFHAKHVLIIFDEATGISKDIYIMAEGLVTSGYIVKWVCIANPTSRASQFFKNTKKAEWHTHTINCFDSPNMKANGFLNKEDVEEELNFLRKLSDKDRISRIKNYEKPNHHLLNAQWAIAKFYEWGFEHPLTKSKILGEFPDTSDNTIISYESIMRSFDRDIEVEPEDKRFIGVDVARMGDDTTVITEIIGSKWIYWDKHGKKRNTEIARVVINRIIEDNPDHRTTYVQIDATGNGSGVLDIVYEHFQENEYTFNVFVNEIHFGQSAENEDDKEDDVKGKKVYFNLKAKIFDKLDKDLYEHLDIPNEEVYEDELSTLLYKINPKGKIQMQSKEDYKKVMTFSPDSADSLALANWGRYCMDPYGSFKGVQVDTPTFASQKKRMPEKRRRGYKVREY